MNKMAKDSKHVPSAIKYNNNENKIKNPIHKNPKRKDIHNNNDKNHIGYKNERKNQTIFNINETDKKIIELLISGSDDANNIISTNSIAKSLQIPLSTVQRRIKKLYKNQIISKKIELNYDKIGYKRGLLHIYLQHGLLKRIGNFIGNKKGILSVSVHVGNSDLVALFVYKNSIDLLETMNEIKQIDGVERLLWSEEVYSMSSRQRPKLFI